MPTTARLKSPNRNSRFTLFTAPPSETNPKFIVRREEATFSQAMIRPTTRGANLGRSDVASPHDLFHYLGQKLYSPEMVVVKQQKNILQLHRPSTWGRIFSITRPLGCKVQDFYNAVLFMGERRAFQLWPRMLRPVPWRIVTIRSTGIPSQASAEPSCQYTMSFSILATFPNPKWTL